MSDCPYRTHPPDGESIQCRSWRKRQEEERNSGKPGLVVNAPCVMYDNPDACQHYQREEARGWREDAERLAEAGAACDSAHCVMRDRAGGLAACINARQNWFDALAAHKALKAKTPTPRAPAGASEHGGPS